MPPGSENSKEVDEHVTAPEERIKDNPTKEVAEGKNLETLADRNQPLGLEPIINSKWPKESAGSLETLSESNEELRPSEVPEGEVFYVANAGVVLLHPFLTAYFEELGLQPDYQPDRRRAVQLIQFLATGESQTPEYDLLLPKILTGWPIDRPVDGELDLTEKEITESESLLKQVIDYWGALGSTSPDGLREGFLHRDGRLSKRSDGWLLQVETKTLDILLGQLPWGLGVIKHAWMTEFLYVEWC